MSWSDPDILYNLRHKPYHRACIRPVPRYTPWHRIDFGFPAPPGAPFAALNSHCEHWKPMFRSFFVIPVHTQCNHDQLPNHNLRLFGRCLRRLLHIDPELFYNDFLLHCIIACHACLINYWWIPWSRNPN